MNKISLLPKQSKAFRILTEPKYAHVNELLFGGGSGGGKSLLLCVWLISQCLKYPETRWVMGRQSLKDLKETTLRTFFDVASMIHLQYDYHENRGIKFPNGSEILTKDLGHYPSDPEYSTLGSLEITGAAVDECNQITEKCWNILKSRIRYRLDENGISPKILGTCNPDRNWVYARFYEPFSEGTLPENRMFLQSLLKDNPYISTHYEKTLDDLDEMSRKRLKHGDWDYVDMTNKWAYAFNREKHLGKTFLNKGEHVYLSFDFNRNPMTCFVAQHYHYHIYGIEQIEIDDCTINGMCEYIKKNYHGCFFYVTGDVSGSHNTVASRLTSFDVIRQSLRLHPNQMNYSGVNPPLAESRILVNAMLEKYPMIFDTDKCAPLIRDFELVKSDSEGKPIKKDRTDIAQRADNLDCFRYLLHRYFSDYLKILAR